MEGLASVSEEDLSRFKALDFEEIEEDIDLFKGNETVLLALQRGVDLNKYGRELAQELKQVLYLSVFECDDE